MHLSNHDICQYFLSKIFCFYNNLIKFTLVVRFNNLLFQLEFIINPQFKAHEI